MGTITDIIFVEPCEGRGGDFPNPVFRRKYYENSGVNKRATKEKDEKASKYWKKSQYILLALSFGMCYNNSTS